MCLRLQNILKLMQAPDLNMGLLFALAVIMGEGMLQDTSTVGGAFSHAFKAYQVSTFSNDLFARDQNHEKKHHPPWSIASVLQLPCCMR